MSFPKIIHSISPADKSKWHSSWSMCNDSWFQHFDSREFQFKIWDDEYSLENFVRNFYPEFLDSYLLLPHKIMKIDIARLLILHKFGGIYRDMDYYVLKNFYYYVCNLSKKYKTKQHNFFVGSASKGIAHETVSNFIMVSEKNCSLLYYMADWFLTLINKIRETPFYSVIEQNKNPCVSALTGPLIMSSSMLIVMDAKKGDDLNYYLLDSSLFNPDYSNSLSQTEKVFNENVFGKHLGSAVWIK